MFPRHLPSLVTLATAALTVACANASNPTTTPVPISNPTATSVPASIPPATSTSASMPTTMPVIVSSPTAAATFSPSPTTKSASGQKFRVVSGYEGMGNFVDASRSTTGADARTLYQKYVVDPYWQDCAAGGEYIGLAKNAVQTPITDLDGLATEVKVLGGSGVEQVVEEALNRASTFLPGPDTTVCVFGYYPGNIFVRDIMHGIYAFTAGSGKIWIQINPVGDWIDWVPYNVAHEYHHSVWKSRYSHKNKADDYLVGYLIFEGRADSFARLVYPKFSAPWTNYLALSAEAAQWKAMQSQLDSTDSAIQQSWMFGGSKGIPLWTGYTIGYHIVQAYLKTHPGVTIEQWTAMDPYDLLKGSGYDGQP